MKSVKYLFGVEKACRSYKNGGKELWTLTVRASSLPRGLKFGPNARYASLTNRPAREMLQTLEQDPESFVLKNNGIMILADSIKVKGDSVELVCNESEPDEDFPGHGVLNGGHTYKVLEHALDSKDGRFDDVATNASVILTVGLGIPEEEIPRISRARNTSEKVPLHALRELAGDWGLLKTHLPKKAKDLVAFKLNDPDAPNAEYDATDLVRRLALLNNELFPAQKGVHPTQAYTSIGSLVKKYSPDDFLVIAPLLPDALKLEELVVRHWEKVNGKGPGKLATITAASGCSKEPQVLLSGYKAKITLAAPFVLPVIAAFRVFLDQGKWVQPLSKLWDDYGPATVAMLWETYKEQGKSSSSAFGRAKSSWAAACDLTKSAALQLGYIKVV